MKRVREISNERLSQGRGQRGNAAQRAPQKALCQIAEVAEPVAAFSNGVFQRQRGQYLQLG